jgi:YHS domain-containing protein
MKDFIRCKMCYSDISEEACELAGYKAVIDGSEYVFCCKHCADDYKKKRK